MRPEELVVENNKLKERIDALDESLRTTERAMERLVESYRAVERDHDELTNLFVITQGLHSTLDRKKLHEVIRDVVLNLVGCEQVAHYERVGDALELTWSVGAERLAPRIVPWGAGGIGALAAKEEVYLLDAARFETRRTDEPSAVVPLRFGEQTTGVLVLFGLLPQRSTYAELDRAIFELLSVQAAVALTSAAFYREAALTVRPGDEPS
jgi:GAF domain-containing protein